MFTKYRRLYVAWHVFSAIKLNAKLTALLFSQHVRRQRNNSLGNKLKLKKVRRRVKVTNIGRSVSSPGQARKTIWTTSIIHSEHRLTARAVINRCVRFFIIIFFKKENGTHSLLCWYLEKHCLRNITAPIFLFKFVSFVLPREQFNWQLWKEAVVEVLLPWEFECFF